MEQELLDLHSQVSKVKDLHPREFRSVTQNFYVLKAALRYYSENQGLSITSSRIKEDFPLNAAAAGSCLKVMDFLEVVETRNNGKRRVMPDKVDLNRLEKIGDLLRENQEIRSFKPGKKV
ncbi:MAG: hypothetical protein ABEJ93_01260 [Candidatus Nanohalobium sp.]